MRAAVVVAWRPKHFPAWQGRRSEVGRTVPSKLAYDRAAAPYVGIHLASLLPRSWDVTLVHEMVRDVDLEMPVDVVFLSTMDYCASHARWLADELRARGVSVVVGGLFPTLDPGYFAGHADAVVVGEAEPVMPRIVRDLEAGRLEPLYRSEAPADLALLPVPRYDLVETDFTMTMAYEATRGCPFTCSFCVLSAIRDPYRRRPIENVVRDIQSFPPGWSWVQRKYVTFWDNNLGADRKYFQALCEALVPLKRFWATQTSFDTITPESARLMGRSGCRFVYVGLESLAEASLSASNKRHNQVGEYRRRLRMLHDNGIVVMSLFLLGLDGDTPAYLKELPDLIDAVGVDVPVLSLPVPIDETPFRRELSDAGRLLPGPLHDGMDGVHLVYRPRNVSPDELEWALFDAMRRVYSPWRVARRMLRRIPDGLWCALTNAGANLDYRRHQTSRASAGLARIQARGPWAGTRTADTSPAQARACITT
jgi:radical SAM superfamily enzyme YgiQ (UPF0313 family)